MTSEYEKSKEELEQEIALLKKTIQVQNGTITALLNKYVLTTHAREQTKCHVQPKLNMALFL